MNVNSAWQRAQEEANAIPALRMQFFLSRINYVMIMANDLLDLHAHTKDQLISKYTSSMLTLLGENPQLLNITSPTDIDIVNRTIKEGNMAHVSGYREWILNQALVSLCTFLDAFLEETVDIVLRQRVDFLYDTKASKEATFQEIVENGLSKVIDEVRRKEVGHFAHLTGIKSRVKYFESKLDILTNAIFDWSHFNDGHLFSHWTLDYLSDTYDKRHDVVHHDTYPIKTLKELKEISDAFSKIILNLSREVRQKYSIMLDINRTILLSELYQRYQKETRNSKNE